MDWAVRGVWLDQDVTEADTRAAFRGRFHVAAPIDAEITLSGGSWFDVSLDGRWLCAGPDRMHPDRPEHRVVAVRLEAGDHLVAAHVVWHGVEVRTSGDLPAFLALEVCCGADRIALDWRCLRLDGHWRAVRRISPQMGWMDWDDLRATPEDWQAVGFDDSGWSRPRVVEPFAAGSRRVDTPVCRREPIDLEPVACGLVAEVFGYDRDDPATRFFLRDLVCDRLPAQGEWRRYDLGRVRVGVPEFVLDLPAGAEVEICSSERLDHDRVSPWQPWSLGLTCGVDHYYAREGRNTFRPLNLRGGRHVEVHVLAPRESVRWVCERWLDHFSLGEPGGEFRCGDEVLDRIWRVGLDTLRAGATDALIDSVREMGQWGGDNLLIAGQLLMTGWGEDALLRRAMRQLAEGAGPDGLVQGLGPGHPHHMPTYAAQWATAVVAQFHATNDRSVLDALWPAAAANAHALAGGATVEGVQLPGWNFVDWSYPRRMNGFNPAVCLFVREGLRASIVWAEVLGRDVPGEWSVAVRSLEDGFRSWSAGERERGGWKALGWHVLALMLRDDAFAADGAIDALVELTEAGHPWNPDAPRLWDMRQHVRDAPTPHFMMYVFDAAARHGRIAWAVEMIRRGWQWCLDQGLTTWPEVFESRWSHCHYWSGTPTPFLTRHVAGVVHEAGGLRLTQVARGFPGVRVVVPLRGGVRVEIHARATVEGSEWSVFAPEPVLIACGSGREWVVGKKAFGLGAKAGG